MLDHHHPHLSIHVTEDYLALATLDKSYADKPYADADKPFHYASLSPPSDPDAPDSPDPADSLSPPPSATTPPAILSYPAPYDDHRRSASFEDDLYAPRPSSSGNQQHTPQYAYYPLEGGPSSPPSPADIAFQQRLGNAHRLSLDAHAASSSSPQYAFDAARRLSEPTARLRMASAAHGAYPPSLPSLASISSSIPSAGYPSHHLSLHTSSYAYGHRDDAYGHHQRIRAEEFSPRPNPARGYSYPTAASSQQQQQHQLHWDYASSSSDSTDARRPSVSGSGPLTTEPLAANANAGATMTATSAVDTPATGLTVGIGIGLDVGINGELGTGAGVGGGSSSMESVGVQDQNQVPSSPLEGHSPVLPTIPSSIPSSSNPNSSPSDKHQQRPGGKNSKTYSFVALPGNAVKKRPRRRYDEIERLYRCSFPNCTKAYGTLNHLNAHVTMQKHGSKRSPAEFKELRKQWRQAKKEAEDAERELERQERTALANAHSSMHHSHHSHHHPHHHALGIASMMSSSGAAPGLVGGTGNSYGLPSLHSPETPYELGPLSSSAGVVGMGAVGSLRRRGSQPYPSPHVSHHTPHQHHANHYAPYANPHHQRGSMSYPPEDEYGATAGLPSPVEDARYQQQQQDYEEEMYYQQQRQQQHRQQQQQQQQSYFPPTPTSATAPGPAWEHSHPPQHQHAHSSPTTLPSLASHSHPHTLPALSSLSSHSHSLPSLASHNMSSPTLAYPPDDEPSLVNHVSLGSNRLPPDSTLLTALPGYHQQGNRDHQQGVVMGVSLGEERWEGDV